MSLGRKVQIKTDEYAEIIVIESSKATTYGELQKEINEQLSSEGKTEINFSRKNAVDADTMNGYALEDAVLPEGPFSVGLYPKETKAGADKYEDMSHSELRAECKDREGLTAGAGGSYGTSPEMRQKLREDDAKNGGSSVSNEVLVNAVDELAETTITKLNEIRELASSVSGGSAGPSLSETEFLEKVDRIGKALKKA